MKEIPGDDRANQGPMKVLGLTWDIESNMIGLNKKKTKSSNSKSTQKRSFKTDIISLWSVRSV